LTATKYSYVGGFKGTSNVYAGKIYNVPISGTLAHSYIMSFEDHEEPHLEFKGVAINETILNIRKELGYENTKLSELWAFASYMCCVPLNFLALIDTFDSLNSGLRNFLICATFLAWNGYQAKGIRLDSGDLAGLSIECKK